MVTIIEQRMLFNYDYTCDNGAHISGFKPNVKKCYHIEKK